MLEVNGAINMTGSSTALNNIFTRQLSLRDAAGGTGYGTSIYTSGNNLTFDSRGPTGNNSTMNFFVNDSSNNTINVLQLSPTANYSNVLLDMTGSGSYVNATIRSRVYGFKDLNTGTSTSSALYYNINDISGNILNILNIDSTGVINTTPTAMYMRTVDSVGAFAPRLIIDYNGNTQAFGTVTAVSFTATSDYRAKENIKPLNLEEYSVDNLNPVHFKFKQTGKESIGLIAHELQEHYPFLVEGEKDGEQKQSVNYNGLIGVLIKEIQELKRDLNNTKCLVDQLRNELNGLKGL